MTSFIKNTFTTNEGCGCMVDWVVLKNGQCLAISEEGVVLYSSYEDYNKASENCDNDYFEKASKSSGLFLTDLS